MMRLASALLILTMVTTCAISGTFAKYVTEDSATDTARVAKWGVKVDVAGDTAFATTYATDEDPVRIANTVVSSTADKLVAPGTEGTLGTVKITGAPEVAVDVKADVNVALSNWTISGNLYFPVKVTVGGSELSFTGCSTVDDVEKVIEDAVINAILDKQAGDTFAIADDTTNPDVRTATKQYEANKDFGNAESAIDVTVDWEWPFDGDDVKDTALGDQAAAGNAAGIGFTCTVTVTQLD